MYCLSWRTNWLIIIQRFSLSEKYWHFCPCWSSTAWERYFSVLMLLINTSFKSGIFLDELKRAVVKHVIKNCKVDANSLSSTSFQIFGKMFIGKTVQIAFRRWMILPGVIRYRQYHHCKTLSICMSNDIFKKLDKGNVAIQMLDMHSAFDTAGYEVLWQTLHNIYGVGRIALQWFEWYLSGRSFAVSINDIGV